MKALVDNDVILKSAKYALLEVLLVNLPPTDIPVGILGSARFVLTTVLRRSGKPDATEVIERILEFIGANETLEPTHAELAFAAELEYYAQSAGLFFDIGESMLCSILVVRGLPLLITGDKRAIFSIEQIIDSCPKMTGVIGKVKCMEQLLTERLDTGNVDIIRMAICQKPTVDKALFICCNCSSPTASLDLILEGLNSYIRSVRASAQRALCA